MRFYPLFLRSKLALIQGFETFMFFNIAYFFDIVVLRN